MPGTCKALGKAWCDSSLILAPFPLDLLENQDLSRVLAPMLQAYVLLAKPSRGQFWGLGLSGGAALQGGLPTKIASSYPHIFSGQLEHWKWSDGFP